ncbi:lipopolysaccharide transport system permease protein [Roseomonas rosea]|uniref:Lipopolysaccharide transport system permease protein n=1 Tax=Muricoccus roseus TaxID=198092 RepID=A0A1M6C5F8_9PROT|nr:ABC transporter permease [Roseomonas rosea]SHI55968.1 lipopolysaccharide transport system permease protein [Roseomonas rosea]
MLAGPLSDPDVYVFDAAAPRRVEVAREDLRGGFASWRLAWALARLDLRNRYRGSVIGPFWMTLSTLLMLVGLGLLYSRLLGLSLAEYLPHLTVSLVVWNIISAMVTDACTTMTSAEGVIRQLRVPFTVHALRSVFRNGLTAAHSLPLIPLAFIVFGQLPGPEALLAVPGLAILLANSFFASVLLGMICARFRDIAPIVANVMQLAFFLTPILWKPELLKEAAVWLPLNPFYAVLETVRGPLVEGGGQPLVWLAAILYTLALGAVSLAFFVRFRGRLAFWV